MVQPIPSMARTIGVLLHPTAFPETPACGSFGESARSWLKFLATNGIGIWQFLPLAPTDSTGSPYASPSSFALNPWFLDVQDLVNEGFIPAFVIDALPGDLEGNTSFLDFNLADLRCKHLGKYLVDAWDKQGDERHDAFNLWCHKQFWLEDHVSFMELRRQYPGLSWWEWPEAFALHMNNELSCWRLTNKRALLEHRLFQWHLDRQWQALRKLANELGVLLIGDLPFYVSRDSADVWSHSSLFSITPDGELDWQSGVPPDYFSNTGQLWGTPVYKWSEHQINQFQWWRSRFARHWEQVDLLRLDHFRALVAFWSVDGKADTAQIGKWCNSPGAELLKFMRNDCDGNLPLIAEDLGLITPDVEKLRDNFSLPGMKVLQFAFDGNPDNPHLPENIKDNNSVIYTGTHDNPTTLGWWELIDNEIKDRVNKKLNNSIDSPVWRMIELALSTESRIVVVPLPDLLCLGDEARFNTPGTIGRNWKWRLPSFDSIFDKSLRNYGERGAFWERSIKFEDGSLAPTTSL